MIRKLFKSIQRVTARFLFLISRGIIRILPYPFFRLISYAFILLGYAVMSKKKKLALGNMTVAFSDEKNSREIKQMMKECFRNIGRGMVELIYFLDRPKKIVEKVRIEGKENLDEALKQGKGVIILSAHLGVFILMYLRIILEGYPTNVIMRRTRDEGFERHISNLRRKMGIKTIYALPQRQCIQESIKVLRNNEILFILLDQNYGSEGGIFVDFFGKKAATAAGPVVFSGRTGAPILPMFIVRESSRTPEGKLKLSDKHKVIIDPPIVLRGEAPNKGENLNKNVQVLSDIIEKYVRKYPYEWGGWMHKRWKTIYRKDEQL